MLNGVDVDMGLPSLEEDVSLSVKEGDSWNIGPNGSGKTTLLIK